jgi:putative acetyltransferase
VELHIRHLTIDDMDAAAKVLRRAFDERLPSLAGLHTPEEDQEYFRNRLFSETEMWGAFDDHLVGFIAFANEWIEQLYILPEWQGRGIGKALVKIAKAKFPSLRLWTFQQNEPAKQFYERNGFVPIETTDGLGNEAKAPDILYQWVSREHVGSD